MHLFETITCKLQGNLTHDFIYLFLQLPYTAFTCVIFDDIFQSLFAELHISFLYAVGFQFFRHEVTTGDFHLFLCDISAHLNQLHAVEQGRRDCSEVVGSGDKHYLG